MKIQHADAGALTNYARHLKNLTEEDKEHADKK